VRDVTGDKFATRATNAFVLGHGTHSLISLPAQRGIKLSPVQELEAKQRK
jgi:hypothetical protein